MYRLHLVGVEKEVEEYELRVVTSGNGVPVYVQTVSVDSFYSNQLNSLSLDLTSEET